MDRGEMIRENVGGEPYEYYALGSYIVSAPSVCGGRPTFKYTRIDVRHAIGLLESGRTVEEVAAAYDLTVEAVRDAVSARAGHSNSCQAIGEVGKDDRDNRPADGV